MDQDVVDALKQAESGSSAFEKQPKLLTEAACIEMELPLCDQSMKRSSTREETDKKQKMKKRRSSLSTKRRSIVDGLVNVELGSDSASQASQGSSTSGSSDQVASQEERLKPNPANLRLDALCQQMEAETKRIESEYDEWQELLDSNTQKLKESETMASTSTLQESSIPPDVKEMAESYIKAKPLDLQSVRGQVTDLLSQYQFFRAACCQDLRLISSTSENLRFQNTLLARQLQAAMDEREKENEDNEHCLFSVDDLTLGRATIADPKAAVEMFISNY